MFQPLVVKQGYPVWCLELQVQNSERGTGPRLASKQLSQLAKEGPGLLDSQASQGTSES